MNPTRQASKQSHLAAVPRDFVDPTAEHRRAADAFLRGQPVRAALEPLLLSVSARFGWVENGYIEQAHHEGEDSRVWDTARRIIASAMAREEKDTAGAS